MHVAMHCFAFIPHVKNSLHVRNLGFSIPFCHLVGTGEDGPCVAKLHECIAPLCMTYKVILGIGTEHILGFAMGVDCLLMLQLYVVIPGLLSRLFSPCFVPLHELRISPWDVCEYLRPTLLCQSSQPKDCSNRRVSQLLPVFVLLHLQGPLKDNFGAGNRNIFQGAMEAIQRSKTSGMFGRANIRGARTSQGQTRGG